MPGIDARAPERTETSKRVVRVAEARARDPLDMGEARLDLRIEAIGQRTPGVVVAVAERRRDGEAGRDRQADGGHLGEVGALAAEQRAHPGVTVRRTPAKAVDPLGHGLASRSRNKHERRQPPTVMPGLDPGIHVLCTDRTNKPWMAGTSPAMTNRGDTGSSLFPDHRSALDLREVGDPVERRANLREHQQPVATERRVFAINRHVIEKVIHGLAERCHRSHCVLG